MHKMRSPSDETPDASRGAQEPGARPAACAVCRATGSRPLYRVPGTGVSALSLFQCSTCEFAFLTNAPDPDEAYGDDYYFFRPWMEPLNRRLAFRRWAELAGTLKGQRLVDVGCGQGGFLLAAKRAGLDARGIEPNLRMAALVRQEVGADVYVGSLSQVENLTNCADTVVSFDVIEHEPDPVRFLDGVRNILVPGGLAIIETPNFGHISRKLMGRNWYALNPYHVSMFSPRTLTLAAANAGLEAVRVETPHVGLAQVLCRLVYEIGPRGFLRVVAHNDRSAMYCLPGQAASGMVRTLAGSLVYRRGPVGLLLSKLGMGDKLRVHLRKRAA